MRNKNSFHSPLKNGDTELKTIGCRHTNPDICAKNMMPKICAFCNTDGICLNPPLSWKKQFKKLMEYEN